MGSSESKRAVDREEQKQEAVSQRWESTKLIGYAIAGWHRSFIDLAVPIFFFFCHQPSLRSVWPHNGRHSGRLSDRPITKNPVKRICTENDVGLKQKGKHAGNDRNSRERRCFFVSFFVSDRVDLHVWKKGRSNRTPIGGLFDWTDWRGRHNNNRLTRPIRRTSDCFFWCADRKRPSPERREVRPSAGRPLRLSFSLHFSSSTVNPIELGGPEATRVDRVTLTAAIDGFAPLSAGHSALRISWILIQKASRTKPRPNRPGKYIVIKSIVGKVPPKTKALGPLFAESRKLPPLYLKR